MIPLFTNVSKLMYIHTNENVHRFFSHVMLLYYIIGGNKDIQHVMKICSHFKVHKHRKKGKSTEKKYKEKITSKYMFHLYTYVSGFICFSIYL